MLCSSEEGDCFEGDSGVVTCARQPGPSEGPVRLCLFCPTVSSQNKVAGRCRFCRLRA